MKSQSRLFTYLHVETQRCSLDVGGWHPDKMGVAVAVTLHCGKLRVFTESDAHLLSKLPKEATVIGYNLFEFDLQVLRPYGIEWLDGPQCLDLCRDVEAAEGRRISLNEVCAATLGLAPSQSGVEMVRAWKRGDVAAVVEGASSTVRRLASIHQHGIAHTKVYCTAQEGRKKAVMVDWRR
jgi:hypothetical protein